MLRAVAIAYVRTHQLKFRGGTWPGRRLQAASNCEVSGRVKAPIASGAPSRSQSKSSNSRASSWKAILRDAAKLWQIDACKKGEAVRRLQ